MTSIPNMEKYDDYQWAAAEKLVSVILDSPFGFESDMKMRALDGGDVDYLVACVEKTAWAMNFAFATHWDEVEREYAARFADDQREAVADAAIKWLLNYHSVV